MKPAGWLPASRFDGFYYFIFQRCEFLTGLQSIRRSLLVTTFNTSCHLCRISGELFSFQALRGVLQAGQRNCLLEGDDRYEA